MPGVGVVRPLVLLGVLVFLLSGCLKLDATLTVNPDNTITGDYVVAYKKNPNATPDTGFGAVRELLVTRGTATASKYDDGDYEGTRYRLEGVPLDDLARFVAVTYDKRQTGTIKITRDGSEFLVAGTFDFRETTPVKRTAEQQRQAEDSFRVRVQLTFPGQVESGNGTIEGNKVTWVMNPFVLNTLQAQASAIPPEVAGPPANATNTAMLLAIGGGVLAVLILLVLGLWGLRRRRSGSADEPTPEPTDPSDFAWVMGERRPPPGAAAPDVHETWAPAAPAMPDVRYGPGLGGPGLGGPVHDPQRVHDPQPGFGAPVGQVSWYTPPAGTPAAPPGGGRASGGPASGPVPVGPQSGPAARTEQPASGPYGPVAYGPGGPGYGPGPYGSGGYGPHGPSANGNGPAGYGPPPAQFRPQGYPAPPPPDAPPDDRPPWRPSQWPPTEPPTEPPTGPPTEHPRGSG
jgi:hypothetical protein